MESEKQALETTVSELRNEIQVFKATFDGQLGALRNDKATLEKALEAERASKGQIAPTDQEPIIVCAACH